MLNKALISEIREHINLTTQGMSHQTGYRSAGHFSSATNTSVGGEHRIGKYFGKGQPPRHWISLQGK